MTEQRFSTTILLSALLLVAAAALWLSEGSAEARVDLSAPAPLIVPGAGADSGPAPTGAVPTPPLPRVQAADTSAAPAAPGPTAPPERAEAAPGLPVRLSIPAIGVDAAIVPVGLEADGTMQIPGATEAGWYLPGRIPGAPTGSAVIAAHIDYDGREGVFFRLPEIPLGAEVTVRDAAGTDHRFVVGERFQVAKAQLPVEELFRTGGDPVMTLITCGGAFDPDRRRYSDNIVVRASPV
jgi:sortase (surface protein transpeptidase)